MITKYIFQLKKQDNCLELQLQHLLTGIKRVKSILLELHPDYVFIILRIFRTLLVAILIFRKKEKLLTVELVQKNKLTILKDKKIFSDPNTLIMNWLKMSVQELIGKEKILINKLYIFILLNLINSFLFLSVMFNLLDKSLAYPSNIRDKLLKIFFTSR